MLEIDKEEGAEAEAEAEAEDFRQLKRTLKAAV
jgi:hypothetical protein